MLFYICLVSIQSSWLTASKTLCCCSLSCVLYFVMHGLQQAKLFCPSPYPGAHSNSPALSRWCLANTSSSVINFSTCLQSFPASGYFPMNWHFSSGGQNNEDSASASVLPMNIQDWFSLGLNCMNSFQKRPAFFTVLFHLHQEAL